MRVGIDVRYLSHGLVGGVHAYVSYFVAALLEHAHEHEFFLYADTKAPFELTAPPPRVTLRRLPYRGMLSSVYNDFVLQRWMAQDRLDVVHFPGNYGFGPAGARTVITLHDAINLLPLADILRGHRRDPRTMTMMTYLHFCTAAAVARAHLIITVSGYSRGEILRIGRLPPERVVAMTHGPSPALHRVTDLARLAEVRQRHQLTRPFVLADALKNPAVIVRAWRRLPPAMRERYQIVFFSRHAQPLPIVLEAQTEGLARLLVRPSSPDLAALYSQAEAFLFPSWIEGLGLPLLEAMTCGAPVIASDRGAIPEVTGDAAWIVDAEDDAALAQRIERLLTEPAAAQQLRERGFARAAQFLWPQTARRILENYQLALALPG